MLFSKIKKPREKHIAAFVDYEHWYIALENLHSQKPDIASWFADMTKRGRVVDAMFFADFSRDGLKDEIARIRTFSNKIIETRNPNPRYKKDYTDFIMLDNIYQRALSNDVDIYVIFSGDGHFSSASSFIKNNLGKEVGIYGVGGAMSKLLKDSSDWYVEIPDVGSKQRHISGLILSSIKRAEKNRFNFTTFSSTVSYVAGTYDLERDDVRDVLVSLIDNDVISQREIIVNKTDKLRVLTVNWPKAASLGLTYDNK
jgi:uncharacterized LabA/DUF88 family protein